MNFQQEIIADRRREQAHDQRDAELDARAETLMGTPDYDPLVYLNFWEALTEAPRREYDDLAALLKDKRFEEAGRELLRMTAAHWKRVARSEIEK